MILVTGAAAAGIAVIQALRERGERAVAVDADPLAAGLVADERVIVACVRVRVPPDLCEAIRRFGSRSSSPP
jgi:nucleoside-diphosphate-sugar epimerase